MKRMATILCLVVATSTSVAQQAKVPISIDGKIELLGDLGVKLGQTATIEGTVLEGPSKGNEGGLWDD